MNFLDELIKNINQIEELPVKMRKGYLGTGTSLVVFPLPGGRTETPYMDGAKDVGLQYEIAMKSKNPEEVNDVLWILSEYLERLNTLESEEFEFCDLEITNKPFIGNADEQDWFVFMLDFKANITIPKEDE